MNPYICVTYARDDRQEADLFCRGLTRYGFRFSCIHERTDPAKRVHELTHAALLIALTSGAAARVETVASDIRHALERGCNVLCVSLKDNELDHRFCTGTVGGAVLIPFPLEDTPDHHTLALFVHRLYVRHLARLADCFSEDSCEDNLYGKLIRCARYAHAGDPNACFELGRAYELGVGVPALEKEAALWLTRAAEQDVCDALIRMGILHLSGQGTERDPHRAFRLFTRAAELGDVRGIYHRGICYLEGFGVMKDPIHAVECLKKAAFLQHAPSMYRLALLHRDGIGTEQDTRTAMKYLSAVCRQGYVCGENTRITPPISVYHTPSPARYVCVTMRQMRRTRLSSPNGVPAVRPANLRSLKVSADRIFGRNTIRARILPEDRWSDSLEVRYAADFCAKEKNRLPVEQDPSYAIYEPDWTGADAALAAYTLGELLALGNPADGLHPSPTRALVWYRYAARLGHTEALYALGDAYRRGFGTPADTGRAVSLFQLAAENGSKRGQFAYAVCCERGIGVSANHREAFRLYELAAEGGYPPAQNNLGGCYEYGIGVQKNMASAVEYYAAAANAGQADSQCRLGICYELGRGVSPDMDKATRLYEAAADHGHAYALYRLALCYDRGRSLCAADDEDNALLTEAFNAWPSEADASERRTAASSDSESFPIDHTRAAAMYKQAADLGIPEAAYAYYLCHRLERGLVRDEHEEIRYLRQAAEANCLQAIFEMGMCFMDGSGLPRDPVAAAEQFSRAVELWRSYPEVPCITVHLAEPDHLPPDAFSPRQAVGGALYMLAFCTLYGIGEDTRRKKAPAPNPSIPPTPERVARAAALLREAADLGHTGSLVMLGDLYAYKLLTSDTASAADTAQLHYLEAVHAEAALTESEGASRQTVLRDRTNHTVDALMSLAAQALDTVGRKGTSPAVSTPLPNAWHAYSACAARGSADALVAMAECLYNGYGTSVNRRAAIKLLERARVLDGGRIAAALWLGDSLRGSWGERFEPVEADEAYLRGLECPCTESENGPYTLALRRADRKKADIRARAEILYRLATLRAVHFSAASHPKESFLYLAEAILMGHTAARDDLARIFAFESKRQKGPIRKANREQHKKAPRFSRKARLRHRMRETLAILNKNNRAHRVHQEWLCDYYTALCLEPEPFAYAMRATAVPSDLPDYVTEEVTDVMRANALQYLGECFFEGYGLPRDPAAAVACYRAVRECIPEGMRNPPASVVEATYSLGWCLLHGVGTAVDLSSAIRLLTSVSATHPGACYTLGLCHEEGRGVVAADNQEAIKFYRKAQRLGHPNAAAKLQALEKKLRNQAS